MVSPTSVWLIPIFNAILLALSTTTSPPITIPATPTTRNNRLFGIDITFCASAASISSLCGCPPSFPAFNAIRIIVPINMAKNTRNTALSKRPSFIPTPPSIISSNAANTEYGKSRFNVAFCTATGVIMAQKPMTTIILKILDPTTLLIASVFLCWIAATTETAVSGSEVPMATIVRPIIIAGT